MNTQKIQNKKRKKSEERVDRVGENTIVEFKFKSKNTTTVVVEETGGSKFEVDVFSIDESSLSLLEEFEEEHRRASASGQ